MTNSVEIVIITNKLPLFKKGTGEPAALPKDLEVIILN